MLVVGGSYKSFYLNHINKIKNIDLLVFNQNIFYEYNYINENFGDKIITRELISLNIKFNCPILVYGVIYKNNIRRKCYILCNNQKVYILDTNNDLYLKINNKYILIGDKIYSNVKHFASILFIDHLEKCNQIAKLNPQNCLICSKKGVSHLKNGKIYRKFKKCCYFTLSFEKKVL